MSNQAEQPPLPSTSQLLNQATTRISNLVSLGSQTNNHLYSQEHPIVSRASREVNRTTPNASVTLPEPALSVDYGSVSPQPPIPAYSVIDPSPSHLHHIPTSIVVPPASSLPSLPRQNSITPTPSTDHTVDPHAPNVDGDTLNLLRYNELHGNGGAPVMRAPEAVHLPRHRNGETDADGLSMVTDLESLPAYGDNIPPRYTRRFENSQDEPQTLAMLFFKFGFFFPAFWVFGALILVTPLRSPNPLSPEAMASAWPPNHELVAWVNQHLQTDEDKAAFLEKMHKVEIKWAKRCLQAIIVLVLFSAAIGLVIFGVLRKTH